MGEIAIDGEKMVVTFMDTFSGWICILPTKKKSKVAALSTEYPRRLENQFVKDRVAFLRCDNAKECVKGDLVAYCEQAGNC